MYKSLLFPVLFLLLSLSVFSQDDLMRISVRQLNTFNRKGIYVGVIGSSDYAYRTLKPTSGDVDINSRIEREIPKISYSVGLSGLWQFKNKLGIEFSLVYSVKGEKTKNLYGIYSSATQTRNYCPTYLEIPLRLNYHFLKGRISPYFFGGASCNILLFNRTKVLDDKVGPGTNISSSGPNYEVLPYGTFVAVKDNRLRQLNMQVLGGIGIDYFWRRYRFKMEPIIKYSINNVSYTYVEHLYSIGVNFGVYYKLKYFH